MPVLLTAENLTLLRGTAAIIKRLSLTLSIGEAIHLTGENGSGKTTLLQMLAGTLSPTAGSVKRDASLLYLGHKAGIKALLTPAENLTAAAILYHSMAKKDLAPKITAALEAAGIAHLAERQCRYLSAGQQRRVQLARLWLETPPIWLLDEPLTALDAATIARLNARIAEHLNHGGCAIITSHQPLDIPHCAIRRLALESHYP